MRTRRTIVKIDEEKCNGCSQCARACAEGAIAIIDGKAKLVSETYCDGLGACLGECPQGAITTEVREAEEFDPAAVEQHLHSRSSHAADGPRFACPSSAAHSFARGEAGASPSSTSQLTNWPVQIALVPPTAPFLRGARLAIAADCTPFAFADFHRQFLAGRVLLIGCPKLDDAGFYRQKLTQLLAANDIQDIEVLFMEVPCCSGLVRIVRDSLADAGLSIPLTLTKIGIHGEIKDRTVASGDASTAPAAKR